MGLFDQLNDKQLEAVRATEGFVRVIAGAGSGKTKLLVSRYAYLVKEYGIDCSNILCVTFTNKAAGEMKKRIRAILGPEYDTSLICTYHGFCARVLRENPEKLFFAKGFQIMDTSQQKAILEDIYQKRELKLDHANFESILKEINVIKSDTDYVPRFCDPKPCQILKNIMDTDAEIIEEFLQRQKAIYSLDFNDLMSFTLFLLETDKEVREKWQDRLNYIQVDEFQDSSFREMRLIDILSAKYKNLMIVGDPDQNIYEWRGSDVKLLVDFDKTHSDTQTIFLNQNYRSTPEILQCANSLIEKNEFRLKKDLFTKTPNGAIVTHYHSKSDEEETMIIVDRIRWLMKAESFAYSDFAILYRSGFLSAVVEKKLVENNVPYEIFGGVKFYQRMEIQDIIAYLKLIAFDDDMSFKRIINTPRRKFGRAKMQRLEYLKEHAMSFLYDENDNSLFTVLKNSLSDPTFSGSDVRSFVEWVDAFRRDLGEMSIHEIVNRVTEESGYEQYIRMLGDEERLENLSEFKRIANEFERSFGEELTLPEFLHQIALQSGEDEEKPRDAVKLMTIHSAKGLEFPVVFIVGFTEGIFPSSKTIEERKKFGLEEERRLCYVAITRAEKYLFIMDSEGLSEKGIKKLPSRFLSEIGIENYHRIGRISDSLQNEAQAYVQRQFTEDIKTSDYIVGSTIDHHVFGTGKIVNIDNKRKTYVIKFDKMPQTRSLSQDYFKRAHEDLPVLGKPEEKKIEQQKPEEKKVEEKEIKYDIIGPQINNFDPEYFQKIVEERAEELPVHYDEYPAYVDTEEYEEKHFFQESEPEGRETVSEPLVDPENLWKRDDVPHTGWVCVSVTDSGGICEMCGYHAIRYVHHMVHHDYRSLKVGCVCAGKMEGNIDAAKVREKTFKNKQKRFESFKNRSWRMSRNGNSYTKIKDHVVILYGKNGRWKYSIDNVFCNGQYTSYEEVLVAAFEALEARLN